MFTLTINTHMDTHTYIHSLLAANKTDEIHNQRVVLWARCSLGSTKSSLSISEHLQGDVPLTSLTSVRGRLLHQGSSRAYQNTY